MSRNIGFATSFFVTAPVSISTGQNSSRYQVAQTFFLSMLTRKVDNANFRQVSFRELAGVGRNRPGPCRYRPKLVELPKIGRAPPELGDIDPTLIELGTQVADIAPRLAAFARNGSNSLINWWSSPGIGRNRAKICRFRPKLDEVGPKLVESPSSWPEPHHLPVWGPPLEGNANSTWPKRETVVTKHQNQRTVKPARPKKRRTPPRR